MKRFLYLLLGLLVIGLIVIQFFQAEKNFDDVSTDAIQFQMKIPEVVKKSLSNSCFNCHSNQTRYPWYGRIAPFSWMIDKHIKDGKNDLNFSEWAKYSKREKIALLDEICEVCQDGSMPLKSYTRIHKDAELFKHEVEDICSWAENAAEEILNN